MQAAALTSPHLQARGRWLCELPRASPSLGHVTPRSSPNPGDQGVSQGRRALETAWAAKLTVPVSSRAFSASAASLGPGQEGQGQLCAGPGSPLGQPLLPQSDTLAQSFLAFICPRKATGRRAVLYLFAARPLLCPTSPLFSIRGKQPLPVVLPWAHARLPCSPGSRGTKDSLCPGPQWGNAPLGPGPGHLRPQALKQERVVERCRLGGWHGRSGAAVGRGAPPALCFLLPRGQLPSRQCKPAGRPEGPERLRLVPAGQRRSHHGALPPQRWLLLCLPLPGLHSFTATAPPLALAAPATELPPCPDGGRDPKVPAWPAPAPGRRREPPPARETEARVRVTAIVLRLPTHVSSQQASRLSLLPAPERSCGDPGFFLNLHCKGITCHLSLLVFQRYSNKYHLEAYFIIVLNVLLLVSLHNAVKSM